MKYYTVPLMNKRQKGLKAFFLGQSAQQKHYRARHRSEDVSLMWLEASQFGRLNCFPCVLDEGGDLLVFRSAATRQIAQQNALLVQRWNLFVNPENIHTDYDVEEMERGAFYALFNECQRKASMASEDGGVQENAPPAPESPSDPDGGQNPEQ